MNPTQFMSRNLIFNTEFQNFIIPGNFQKFSGTLDMAWKWPIFSNFDVLGINSTWFLSLIWIWPQKLKNVTFVMFSDVIYFRIQKLQEVKKTFHFSILRLNSCSVTKIKLDWCPIRQNWQNLAISRRYTEFQKISGSF